MSIEAGELFVQKNLRKLALISGVLALFGPALGREGFDLSYPLIRLVFAAGALDMREILTAEIAIFIAVMIVCWAIYFFIALLVVSIVVFAISSVFKSAADRAGPSA